METVIRHTHNDFDRPRRWVEIRTNVTWFTEITHTNPPGIHTRSREFAGNTHFWSPPEAERIIPLPDVPRRRRRRDATDNDVDNADGDDDDADNDDGHAIIHPACGNKGQSNGQTTTG